MERVKTKSLKDRLSFYFVLILLAAVFSFAFFGAFSVWIYEKELSYCDEKTLDLYANSFGYTLNEMEDFLQTTTTNNIYVKSLTLKGGISADKKLEAEYLTQKLIQNEISDSAAICYFSDDKREFYYRTGANFLAGLLGNDLRNFMEQFSQGILSTDTESYGNWNLYEGRDRELLVNIYRSGDLYMAAMVDLKSYVDRFSDQDKGYVFYDQDRILASSEGLDLQKSGVERVFHKAESASSGDPGQWQRRIDGNIVQSRYLPDFGIGLCIVSRMVDVWKLSSAAFILLLFIVVAMIVFFMLVYGYIKRTAVYPLEQISELSTRMSESGKKMRQEPLAEAKPVVHLDITGADGIREYVMISKALNDLVDQKIELELENEARQREKDQALLQYFQLQTRSHFFLNCLKSLYNMSNAGEIEKMKMMIMGFSNHLRYIFRDNLKLIPLRDEIAEVNDYQSIIQLDSTRPILLDMDIPGEALDCLVPPLLIQTFLENSYKYSNMKKGMLCFRVQVEISDAADRKYLHLKMSDNGSGYSDEILKTLEDDSEEYQQYHVGITNLKRRMKLIYGKTCQTAFFNLPGSGACSVFYIPIRDKENGK
ncbi:Histidine kinase [Lachnospiraceae bacterium NK3A20]|nr:Histidine kinase [Lachnospiraceae bacterium NK3A20]